MTKFLILIYKILSVIFLPIILIIIIFRIFQNKEINNRIKERFAFSSKKRPKGKLIWINASSIGEYLATISLIKKIRKIRPKTKILLTTNTKTSALLAQKITDRNIFHQFTPQDNPLWQLNNVVITPHQSGISQESVTRSAAFAFANVRRAVLGEPIQSLVIPE